MLSTGWSGSRLLRSLKRHGQLSDAGRNSRGVILAMGTSAFFGACPGRPPPWHTHDAYQIAFERLLRDLNEAAAKPAADQ